MTDAKLIQLNADRKFIKFLEGEVNNLIEVTDTYTKELSSADFIICVSVPRENPDEHQGKYITKSFLVDTVDFLKFLEQQTN